MKFELYLLEKSFEMEDIPRTFRVVIEWEDYKDPAKTLKKLSNMKLEGMTGISDKHDIAFHFLGVARNLMIIMKGKEVLKLNKISRIMYDNPHYMLNDNMYALRRIWKKESDRATQQLMFNLLEYYFKALVDNGIVSDYDVKYTAAYQNFSFMTKKISPKINGVKDFVNWVKKVSKAKLEDKDSHFEIKRISEGILNTSDTKLTKSVFDTFKIIKKVYGSEGEWIIKDKTLKIPKGSYLYILVAQNKYKELMQMKEKEPQQYKIAMAMFHKDTVEDYEKIMEAIDKYNLRKNYKVKFIDNMEWQKIQSAHFARK